MEARRQHVAHLRTKWALLNSLRLFWLAVVLWCEVGAFFWNVWDCRWPDRRLSPGAVHVLIVADPQVLDHRSYPGRHEWLMRLTQYVVDLNLRKSWNAVRTLQPHAVVFLGDMMDNGRVSMDEREYSRYYKRFKSIFQLDRSVPVYYLPGNHDVNLGYSLTSSPAARDRYRAHFGPFNHRLDIANHTLLMIDAAGLVDEDYRRHGAQMDFNDWPGARDGTVDFLRSFTDNRSNDTIILFSHIPLFRPDGASCGPLREKGTIRPGVGHGYQNLLLRETSAFVLENVRPSVVFSGDDHDYCEYMHTLADGSRIREVSVKSFSMAMGIKKPGFQLLSLTPASPDTLSYTTIRASTFRDAPCLLPDQINLYTHGYALPALLTVFAILILNYKSRHPRISSSPEPYRQSLRLPPRLQRGLSILPTLSSNPPSPETPNKEVFGLKPMPESDAQSRPAEQEREFLRKDAVLKAVAALSRPARVCGGGGKRSWYSRAAKEVWQVAWPAVWVYIMISIWLFWR